ncbi:MAG: hypothetical protein QOF53_4038 [Nocardioidaceae bacterium]|nr:hypothetical protein [Nocardioidaceae bacterium]
MSRSGKGRHTLKSPIGAEVTATMTGLEHAILGLQQALDAPRRHQTWRRLVRNRMAGVTEALARELPREGDEWLASRELTLSRERDTLVRRLAALGPLVLLTPDVETVRVDLYRLLADVEHHRQRLNDLVYDSVSLELGGSE